MNNNPGKQVEKSHYRFERYMTKERWISIWHQLNEVQSLNGGSVLEIGHGSGLFKIVAKLFGTDVETLDHDPDLQPDHVGTITHLPFPDDSYDVVCAFQVLEHLPYNLSLQALKEMARVSRKHIVISLPDASIAWRYQFHIPKIGTYDMLFPRPYIRSQPHEFDGEHYWEINKQGYELKKIKQDFSRIAKLTRSYRVKDNPYHHFFFLERSKCGRVATASSDRLLLPGNSPV
jgi:SAM-dependent methyltransferase